MKLNGSSRRRRKARLPWTTTKKVMVTSSAAAGVLIVLFIPWWVTATALALAVLCVVVWLCDNDGARLDPQTKGLVQMAAAGVFAIACLVAVVYMDSWKDRLKEEAAAATRKQVEEYAGVYGSDGEWRYKFVHPLERKVHTALKRKFRENPVREIADNSRLWKSTIDANDRLDERLVREVAREFGISKRDVDGIWFKLETGS